MFFMTKYSTDFKIMAVQRYFDEDISIKSLAKDLKLPTFSLLKNWINTASQQGVEALVVKRSRSEYKLDFKANVVEYYQTHDLGVSKVAAMFNISSSQVYTWNRSFENGGLAALVPRQKGRPSTMKKKKTVQPQKLSLSEKQAYEEKIMQLKAQLYQAEMERDLLKKLPPRSKNLRINKKR